MKVDLCWSVYWLVKTSLPLIVSKTFALPHNDQVCGVEDDGELSGFVKGREFLEEQYTYWQCKEVFI
jgi:hypothetical protein